MIKKEGQEQWRKLKEKSLIQLKNTFILLVWGNKASLLTVPIASTAPSWQNTKNIQYVIAEKKSLKFGKLSKVNTFVQIFECQ